jgi:uncharacterized protein YlxP (DUF503 family)
MRAVASGYVGILSFELHFPGERSLKGKRKHLLTLKSHLQQRAGASVAEVDHHDVWQRARLWTSGSIAASAWPSRPAPRSARSRALSSHQRI